MIDRPNPKDVPTGDNPVAVARHSSLYGTGECLGIAVHLWCPGCQQIHAPRFRCPEHGRPAGPEAVVWDGDPNSDPFSMEPSYLTWNGTDSRCHSFVRNGQWQFLEDSTHALAGQTVPLEPLPDWLC